MGKKLTLPEARKHFDAVVSANPGFVQQMGSCEYNDRFGNPVCVVGQVLHRAGQPFPLGNCAMYDDDLGPGGFVDQFWRAGGSISESARKFLAERQELADSEVPWGLIEDRLAERESQ